MSQARLWQWGGVILLSIVGIVAAAGALAQDGAGEDPNVVVEPPGAPGSTLAAEEMAGRSPNGDVAGAASALEADGAPPGALAPGAVSSHGKQFLVTLENKKGNEPLDACPAGFHMASLYELHDVTALSYASDHADAKTLPDQGAGPVVGWWGWVRTGGEGSMVNIAGRANCNLWTSAEAGEYGTLVRLTNAWTGGAVAVSPWEAQTWSCGGIAPVWCIEE